jgi:histidinol-phosphate phosphatase family protein
MNKITITPNWTLFLDRDGVINKEVDGSYVLAVESFEFLPKSIEAMVAFNRMFNTIVVVTNQRCVGRQLLTEQTLDDIHTHMTDVLEAAGARVDKVYYAPDASSTHHLRKPNTGMALLAKNDFPAIDFTKSIMVGNSISDMEFGRKMGMITIYIKEKKYEASEQVFIDYEVENLMEIMEIIA